MAAKTQTRDRILDAAEALFAEWGYDAVSLRDITGAAGVRLALASYHFGTKEALFEAVIFRRASVLVEGRKRSLAEALARPDHTLEDLLSAYILPFYEMMAAPDPGWHHYGRLVAHTAQSNRWLTVASKAFDDIALAYFNAMSALFPGADYENLLRAFNSTVLVMLNFFAYNERIDRISGGRVSAADLEAGYPALLIYVAGGFRALAAAAPVNRRQGKPAVPAAPAHLHREPKVTAPALEAPKRLRPRPAATGRRTARDIDRSGRRN